MKKFKSRKFWMAVAAALLVIANEGLDLNLPEDAIMSVVAVVLGYIFGEAYVDGKKVSKGG